MEKYLAIHIGGNEEILLGLLSALPFESFEETENKLVGYIASEAFTDEVEQELNDILAEWNLKYMTEELEPQNWNTMWEASFQPIEVGNFCRVRADFHPLTIGFDYDLIINPKMAFGTGHHATTYMMMEQMASIEFVNRTVLDYGCGTGILAILASKLGSTYVDAVDIESESYHNTLENCTINHAENINAYFGTLADVPIQKYNIILANINRNVLMDTISDVSERLKPDGILLISGILETDKDAILQRFGHNNLDACNIKAKDGWLSICFKTLQELKYYKV